MTCLNEWVEKRKRKKGRGGGGLKKASPRNNPGGMANRGVGGTTKTWEETVQRKVREKKRPVEKDRTVKRKVTLNDIKSKDRTIEEYGHPKKSPLKQGEG